MRFGGQLEILSRGTRWVITRAHGAGPDDDASRASRSFAASKVDAWCDEVTTWPYMLELYQELAGRGPHPPTTADVAEWIKPRLRRAFEDGTLVVALAAPYAQKQMEQGVHGQPPKIEPPLPPPAPRRPVAPPKTLHSFAIRFVDELGTAMGTWFAMKIAKRGVWSNAIVAREPYVRIKPGFIPVPPFLPIPELSLEHVDPTESSAAFYCRLQMTGTILPDHFEPRLVVKDLDACRNG